MVGGAVARPTATTEPDIKLSLHLDCTQGRLCPVDFIVTP